MSIPFSITILNLVYNSKFRAFLINNKNINNINYNYFIYITIIYYQLPV